MICIDTAKKNSILQTARENLGMTRKEAATAIGVTAHTYWLWEKGELTPKADKTEKIAQARWLPLTP